MSNISHKGDENLIPFNERTEEELREIASKGGKASVESRRKRKALKETMIMLLELPVADKKVFTKMADFGIDVSDINNNTRLMYSLLNRAYAGDVMAIKEARAIVGEDVSADVMDKLDDVLQGLKDNADNSN